MSSIPVAVIGAGRWGRNLIRNLQQSSQFDLKAVHDLNPVQFQNLSVRRVADVDELLRGQDIEAVVIATPPGTHAPLVQDFLSHGKHVLCEKPLALSAIACRELFELAQSRKRCLMVDCTPVYLEEIQTARTHIAWEQVDSIRCVRTSKSVPVSMEELLWDLAPHDLAILRAWLGDLKGSWTVETLASEFVVLQGICPGKPRLSLELGTSDQPRREITLNGNLPPITYYQRQSHPEPLQVVIEQFAKCIHDGTSPQTDAAGALEAALILEEICNDNLFRRTHQESARRAARSIP